MAGSRIRFDRSFRALVSLGVLLLVSATQLASASAAPRRSPARHAAQDEVGVNVTYTGFRMLPDGRALLYVEMTGRVPVTVQKQGQTVTYVLEGAHVALRNNRNPLLTSGFASILESARWRVPKPSKSKKAPRGHKKQSSASEPLALVLTLRAAVEPSHVLRDGASGSVLEITLPALKPR